MTRPSKILQVSAVDVTARFLLLPLLDRLRGEGHEVHVACSPGRHLDVLADRGIPIHPIPIARRIAPLRNAISLIRLARLMRRERFDLVHVHTPVAAALGRIAARITGVRHVVYTAHGFYFHDRMAPWKRRLVVWIERWLGRCCTDLLFTQSAEDAETAVHEKIVPRERVVWIGNGVDLGRHAAPPNPEVRRSLDLETDHLVVGFVGRLVREKGIVELFEAMACVHDALPHARLLIVGDTLASDRDRKAISMLHHVLERHHLQGAIRFAGFREDIPDLLAAMDVFVLPSHREGMPRTILEAMATGVPVVATDIRGCREEVVDGVTGFLVPVNSPSQLAAAILRTLEDRDLASRLGEAGRARARAEFNEDIVLERQIAAIRSLLGGSATPPHAP